MLAPESIHPSFFAPCGMNCLVCYRHMAKKPCAGCHGGEENKPPSCRACTIRACAGSKGVRACFACADFPCAKLKTLDRSYRLRYGVSLIEQGRTAASLGIEACLRAYTGTYTCECGGLISLHDGDCSECGKAHPLGKRSLK